MAMDLMSGKKGGQKNVKLSGGKIQSPVTGGGSSTPQSRVVIKKRSFKGKR